MKQIECNKCGNIAKKWEKFCSNCWAELLENSKSQNETGIKKDFIQEFFEKNNIVRISKIAEFLFCNKNRISWNQAFAWYIKLWFICWLLLLPLKLITLCLWNSWQGGTLLSVITYIWFAVVILFFLIMYIKQNISRLHDIWWSWWRFLLTINPTFFIILLFIPWDKNRNIYWEPNIIKQQWLTELEKKEQNKKLSLIVKIPVIIIAVMIILFTLLILINI